MIVDDPDGRWNAGRSWTTPEASRSASTSPLAAPRPWISFPMAWSCSSRVPSHRGLGGAAVVVGVGGAAVVVGLGGAAVVVGLGGAAVVVGLGGAAVVVGLGGAAVVVGLGAISMG